MTTKPMMPKNQTRDRFPRRNRFTVIVISFVVVLSVVSPWMTMPAAAAGNVFISQTPSTTSATPGTNVTFQAQLQTPDSYFSPGVAADLPDGWTIVSQSTSPPTTFRESANEWVWITNQAGNETVNYTVHIPDNASDGSHSISINGSASDAQKNFESDEDESVVSVQRQEVQLELSPNRTSVTVGDSVRFHVSRQDNDAPVDASVDVDGTTLQTGADGNTSYTFASSGPFTATASKEQTTTERFLNDTATISVAAPAGPGGGGSVSSCEVIDSPGTYTLSQDIIDSPDKECIYINSSDVVFDGDGHIIDGDASFKQYWESQGYGSGGVVVEGPPSKISNVTVKDVRSSDWNQGVYFTNVTQSTILNTTTTNNTDAGVHLERSTGVTVRQNDVSANDDDGIELRNSSQNDVSVNDVDNHPNGVGIIVGNSSVENDVMDNDVRNSKHGIVVAFQSTNNTVVDNLASSSSRNNIIVASSDFTNVTANEAGPGLINGIYVSSSDHVILERNDVNGTDYAITLNNSDVGDVIDNVAANTDVHGIRLENGATDAYVYANVVSANDSAFIVQEGSPDSYFVENLARDSEYGYVVSASQGNRFVDNEGNRNNWTFVAEQGAVNNTVTDLEQRLTDTTLSFDARSVRIQPEVNPPPDPPNQASIGRFLNAVGITEKAYLDVSIQYEPGDVSSVDETSLVLKHFDNGSWETVPGSSVDIGADEVSGNVTDFSTVGVFGNSTTGGAANATVISKNVTIVEGPGTTPYLDVFVPQNEPNPLLQVQLKTAQFGSYELESLGINESTRFRIDVAVGNFTPRLIIGSGKELNWTTHPNPDNSTNVTIWVNPAHVESRFPSPAQWNGSIQANDRQNQTVQLALDQLDGFTAAEQEDLNTTILATDAQELGSPQYRPPAQGQKPQLSIYTAAPHFRVDGANNTGFVDAYLPGDLLDEWGVSSASDLRAASHGSQAQFTVTDLPEGALRVFFPVEYSDGNVVITTQHTPGVANLSITANRTAAFTGDAVKFTVRREDTGATVDANVTIDGTTLSTGSDGNVTHTFGSAGSFTATASKGATANTTFVNDSVTISVSEPLVLGPDETIEVTDNTDMWKRAPLPLRSDVANDAQTKVDNLDLRVRVDDPVTAEFNLNKPQIGVFQNDTDVTLTFDPARANGNSSAFANQELQIVTARLDRDVRDIDVPESVTEAADLLADNRTASAEVVGTMTLDGLGAGSTTFHPDQPGHYVVFVGTPTTPSSTFVTTDGNLTVRGEMTVTGFDVLSVQEDESSVSVTTEGPSNAAVAGQNVTFAANASPLAGDDLRHVVLLYDEATFVNQTAVIDIEGEIATDLNITDNTTILTTIDEVKGVGISEDDVEILGVNLSDGRVTTAIGAGTAVDFLFEKIDQSPPNTQDIDATTDVTLNASATALVGNVSENVTVETHQGFRPAQYRFVHIATNPEGTEPVSTVGTLQVKRGVQLNVSLNRSAVVQGQGVLVSVTREDTGAPVNATVTIDGTTLVTGADGSVTHRPAAAGNLTVRATKPETADTVFLEGTATLNVTQRLVDFTYSDLVVSPNRLNQNETITASADVENTGTVTATFTAELKVDGTVVDTQQGTLAPGENTTVAFTRTMAQAGTFQVTIDALTAETVEVLRTGEVRTASTQIAPTSILVGESVTANATFINVGDTDAEYNVTFAVNGSILEFRQRTLGGGDNRTESFTHTFDKAGNHTVTIGNLPDQDDVTANITVQQPATFSFSNLQVSKTTANVSEPVSISATVTNTGDLAGSFTARLSVNGSQVATKSGILDGGQSTTVTFSETFLTPGPRTVTISGLPTKTVNVVQPDLRKPSIVLQSPTTRTVSYGTAVDFDVSDNVALASVTYTRNTSGGGAQPLAAPYVISTGTWPEGPTRVNVTATDTAGNSLTRSFVFDFSSPPTVDSVSPTGLVGTDSPTVKATYSDTRQGASESGIDTAGVRLFVDGTEVTGSATVTGSDVTYAAGGLSDGRHTARVFVRDQAGHTVSSSWTFRVDDTAPQVSISASPNTSVSRNNPTLASFSATDPNVDTTRFIVRNATTDTQVFSEDVSGAVRLSPSGIHLLWTATQQRTSGALVQSGDYDLVVNSTDSLGNTAEASVTVSVDNDPPTITFTRPTGATVRTNSSLNVTATVDGTPGSAQSVRFIVNKVGPGPRKEVAATPIGGDRWTRTIDLTTIPIDGRYVVRARATDQARNEQTATASTVVVLDRQAPGLSTTVDVNGTVNVTADEPLTGPPSTTVRFPNGTTQPVSMNPTAPGSATSFSGTISVADNGTYAINATGEDRAGNIGRGSDTVTVFRQATENQTLLVYNNQTGIFVRINTTEELTNNVVILSETPTPFAALPPGFGGGGHFLDAITGGQIKNQSKIQSVDIGIPQDLILPPGVPENAVVIVFFDPATGQWVPQPTRIEDLDIPLNGQRITGRYYLTTRTHLSKFGGAARDREDPEIDLVQLDGVNKTLKSTETLPVDTTEVSVRFEHSDDVSGIDTNETRVTFDNGTATDVTNETATSIDENATVYNSTDLDPGTYNVSLHVEDRVGNVTESYIRFTIPTDNTPPAITVRPSEGTVLAETRTTVPVNGTFTDPQTGVDNESVTILVDGTDVTSGATISANRVDATVGGLTPGSTHNVTVAVNNTHGVRNSTTANFSVASDGPEVTFVRPTEDQEFPANRSSVELVANYTDAGVGIDATTAQIRFDGSDVTAQGTTNATTATYTATGLSVNASYNFTVSIADTGGATTNATVNFSIAPDQTPPAVNVSPADGTVFSSGTTSVPITLNYSDGETGVDAGSISLAVDGSSVTPATSTASQTTFTKTGLQNDTTHGITFNVRDQSGNLQTSQTSFGIGATAVLGATNATLSQSSIVTGESVTITADVKNFGGARGTSTISLFEDGVSVDSRQVTLDGGQSTQISFTQTFNTAGTFSMKVGSSSAGAVTVQQANPQLDVPSASLSDTSINTGQSVTVTATVRNIGNAAGTFDVDLEVDGSTVETQQVTLGVAATKTITFSRQFNNAGDFDVSVNGTAAGTVSVSEAEEEEAAPTGGGGGAVPAVRPEPTVDVGQPVGDRAQATIENARANTPIAITVPSLGAARTTGGQISEISVTPTTDTSFDLDVTASQTVPAGTPDVSAAGAVQSVSYFNIGHTLSDDQIDEVGFSFRVRKTRLNQLGQSPDQVSLYRFSGGQWAELSTSVTGESDAYYEFTAQSPGLSVFAIGVKQAGLAITSATLDQTTIQTGDRVTVTAAIENTGEAEGTVTAVLLVNGQVITQQPVTIPPGETRDVSFVRQFTNAGTFMISVSGTTAGQVTVQAPATPTATPSPETPTATAPPTTAVTPPETPTATPPVEEPAGLPLRTIGLVIILAVIIAAAALYYRRRMLE